MKFFYIYYLNYTFIVGFLNLIVLSHGDQLHRFLCLPVNSSPFEQTLGRGKLVESDHVLKIGEGGVAVADCRRRLSQDLLVLELLYHVVPLIYSIRFHQMMIFYSKHNFQEELL